ncbi:MAG TPA: MFS transporter [Gammaproteobacteria bacterium]|jgi:PAT family beta-lactamase induction signal transducer AmpG|nr:MFS transporter [Gammaproteobacteria bacterium]
MGLVARWREALSIYAEPRVRAMLFLGYSSGLPFALVLTTLAARLKQAGIDRGTIGYFAWVGFAYSLKFFWSPFVDRLQLPLLARLGRRRSWMLLAQCGVMAGLLLMAFADPAASPAHMALLATGTAFFAATQDIAVDAYRIEAVATDKQAGMAAAYQTGYQVALICAGAGALTAAAQAGWTAAYCVMAALVLVGMITVFVIAEPETHMDRGTLAREQRVVEFLARSAHWPEAPRQAVAWLIGAVVCPFMDFFARNGWRAALPILVLIVTYRLNYMTMGVMANPFYLDMGFTLEQIAVVSKLYGIIMTLIGALTAGVLVVQIGILRTMLLGLFLLTAANLFYGYIADIQPGVAWFAAAVSLDNVANGIAGTSFIAYMSSLTNSAYTATQYALFGTLWSFPAKGLAGFSGKIVDALGYRQFFFYTALIGLPAFLLVLWMLRRPAIPAAQAPRPVP